ncbi:MAG: ribonuclease Z [Halobacteriota archaeon]
MLNVLFLGTGGSMPTVTRNLPAILIKRAGETILFDCGEGTQRQMMRCRTGINISSIFITHWHADHFLGLPGLIHTMSFQNRTDKLEVYGPRWAGVPSLFALINPRFEVDFIEVAAGDIIKKDSFCVRVFAVDHVPNACGYVFQEYERPGRFNRSKAEALGLQPGPLFKTLQKGKPVKVKNHLIAPSDVIGPPRAGRKIVYTGDTRPYEGVVEAAQHADMLIHEATLADDLTEYADTVGHATASEAADIALRAQVEVLVLTHISSRYANAKLLLDQAQQVFKDTIMAEDYLSIDVPYKD